MVPIDRLVDIFGRVFVSRLTGLLEGRGPILYSDRDVRVGGQFGRRFSKINPNIKTDVPLTYRNAFLWGCANHVRNLDYEVMVLGFGQTQGTRNKITSIMKIEGDKHSVSPTTEIISAVGSHLAKDNRSSVILVHNHPEHILRTALSVFLGTEPLPSLKDRNSGLSVLIHRLETQMKGNRFGSVRFFLIENDEAAEFSGLNIGTMVDVLRRSVVPEWGA